MQKFVDASYFDWSKNKKPVVLSRGIASLAVAQMRTHVAGGGKSKSTYVWPSGLENVDNRYVTRKVWSR
ncbi:MAG: hypothetical protein E7012_02265 [Alphaproteobacteria bacterium]|nr:hypothetical protein [Alphaproteobacteria bacterium]